jgi:hypothetical protein
MPKHRKDPSTVGLGSPEVKGQGTTTTETGAYELDSARKKKKQPR